MAEDITYTIEDAQLIFKNFAGAERLFNKEGDRNFCVLLEDAQATWLAAESWNIKTLEAKEEGDVDRPYIPVAVKYGMKPPRIVAITDSGVRTELNESMVEMLDWADVRQWDLVIRAYDWELKSGAKGRKAYVKTLFAVINEDDIERKYNVNGLAD